MAKQKKEDGRKFRILWFIIGIAAFVLSLSADGYVNELFNAEKPQLLNVFFSIITNFGFDITILFFIPIILLYNKKQKKQVYSLLLALILSIAASFILKAIFAKIRPDAILSYPLQILDYSFPSMHSAVVFASLPILARNIKYARYFTIFAVLAAFSRLYLGFHYLSDIVFGAFAGYLIGGLSIWAVEKWQ